MKMFILIFLTFIAILLLASVIYLSWENRDSNTLVLKVLSFFVVGLFSILLTIFLQEEKDDIKYTTTSSIIIDSDGLPYILSKGIDKKDDLMINILSNNNGIKVKILKKENNDIVYFDLFASTFLHFLNRYYSRGWYINYDYNKLTSSATWGVKENLESKILDINDLALYSNEEFNFRIEFMGNNQMHVPVGTEIKVKLNNSTKEIIFENKYFTYSIQLINDSFHIGLGKHSNLIDTQGLSTYYYKVETLCKFNKLYPNNPKIIQYEKWVNNMNALIDSHFNSFKSITNYEKSNYLRRLIY